MFAPIRTHSAIISQQLYFWCYHYILLWHSFVSCMLFRYRSIRSCCNALYRAIICGVHTFCYCMYFLDTFVSACSDHGIHTHNFTSKLASIPQVQHAAFSVCGHILVNVVLSDKYLWQLTYIVAKWKCCAYQA